MREYAAVASIRRYIMIESAWAGVSALERRGPADPWRASALSSDDVILMGDVGVEIPVAELYEGLILGGGSAAG